MKQILSMIAVVPFLFCSGMDFAQVNSPSVGKLNDDLAKNPRR